MYRTILVPFDGSALSATAIPLAIELARRTAATVHLAMVHDPSAYIPFVAGEVAVPIYDSALEREHRAADAQKLEAAVADLRAGGVPTVGVTLEGSIADALERYVEQIDADLTVMTTHGRSGFQRLRLGSVATAFLTRITHPVLLLRAEDQGRAPAVPNGPVVCALDGSPFAEAMLPHARAFAEATALPLHFVGVSIPHAVPMAPFGAETLMVDEPSLHAEIDGRRDYLSRRAAEAPAGTTFAALEDMSVTRALLSEAERLHAGAIAIATHGRSGFARFMLGSTTDELMRHAHVPVLAYRPHGAGH
jgi:nucleotide-binding universal stress UspA family protein